MRDFHLGLCLTLLFLSSTETVLVDVEQNVSPTPPMGWLSWVAFGCRTNCQLLPDFCISERLYMTMADHLVSEGYWDAGYRFVNIDDCWSAEQRNSIGRLVANKTRFPHGIKWLANYMHDRGLKFGIYGDVGNETCAKYPGSYGYSKVDAETFADWGVDSLKFDGCNLDPRLLKNEYPKMSSALKKTSRKILFTCSWPYYEGTHGIKPNFTAISEQCNSWRSWSDMELDWGTITGIIDWTVLNQDTLSSVVGPNKWNDPDVIIAGNPGLTIDEQRSQFAIWSIWAAPLIMSNDLRLINPDSKSILLNRGVIAINQDPLGIMGKSILKTQTVQVFLKPVTPYNSTTGEYSYGVVLFNRGQNKTNVSLGLSTIGLTSSWGYYVEGLFEDKQLGVFKPHDKLQFTVNPHGVIMIKATLAQLI